jgi:hypothetical protein
LKRTIEWSREKLEFIDACIRKHEAHLKAAEFAAGRRMV